MDLLGDAMTDHNGWLTVQLLSERTKVAFDSEGLEKQQDFRNVM